MVRARRRLLKTGAGIVLAGPLGSRQVFGTQADAEQAIAVFSAGQPFTANGPLTLEIPEIAENGFYVPMSIAVQSPMSADDHVESVLIVAPGNPNPKVARFHFTPAGGRAAATLRIRLARTQEVIAVARTSTGKLYRTGTHVTVAIGGCGS